jgi:hypothetical protein
MPKFLLPASTALLLALTTSNASSLPAAHFWSQWFGDAGFDQGTAVAVDASGNVFVTGGFNGTVNFGRDVLTSAGFDDIFLAKYASNGAPQWAKRFGDTDGDVGYAVGLDAAGNVFVTGIINGTVDFGGGPLVVVTQTDVFLAKFDTGGSHLWSQRFGDFGPDFGNALAIDNLGNVIITGGFQNTVDFGGGPFVSLGGYDIFVAKYNASGTHQWSRRFGNTNSDDGVAIAVDAARNVVVTGRFQGSVDFGGGALVSASGSPDIFLAKYNENAVHQWSRRFGNAASELGRSVATDAGGNVIMTGTFQNTVDFGGGGLTATGIDIVLAKYATANGAHVWSKRLGGTSSDTGTGVAVDAAGNVQLTGVFISPADFGGGPIASAAGTPDVFHVKYTSAGAHVWSGSHGGAGGEVALAIALDGFGNAVLTGYFDGPANLGGSVLPGFDDFDIFLAKYGRDPAPPVITSIDDIPNDQGGKVKVRFNRSGHDQLASPTPTTAYEVYRRDDPPPASSIDRREIEGERESLIDGWSFVATVPSHGETTYGIDVATIGDSTIAFGQYHSVFFVRNATGSPFTYFDSPPDSGYSLDNLAPGAPQSLMFANYHLFWSQPPTADFDYFTVYGASTADFGTATLIDYTVTAQLNVSAAPYVFYFVTATDFSGNESLPASLDTVTDIDQTPQQFVLSVGNYPNPFNPRTTVRFTVPFAGPVTVAIYDARGARVATLVDRTEREAGAYRVEWSGRSDNGNAVSSGIYFARIEHAGAIRSKKMVMLK